MVVSTLATSSSAQPKPFRSSFSLGHGQKPQGNLSQTSARFVTAPCGGPSSNVQSSMSFDSMSNWPGTVVRRLGNGNQYPSANRKSAPSLSSFPAFSNDTPPEEGQVFRTHAGSTYILQGKTNSTLTAHRPPFGTGGL